MCDNIKTLSKWNSSLVLYWQTSKVADLQEAGRGTCSLSRTLIFIHKRPLGLVNIFKLLGRHLIAKQAILLMELYAWNRLKEAYLQRMVARLFCLVFDVVTASNLFVCFCLRLAQFLRWQRDGLLYVRMKCEIPEQHWKLKRKHCSGDICCVGLLLPVRSVLSLNTLFFSTVDCFYAVKILFAFLYNSWTCWSRKTLQLMEVSVRDK